MKKVYEYTEVTYIYKSACEMHLHIPKMKHKGYKILSKNYPKITYGKVNK